MKLGEKLAKQRARAQSVWDVAWEEYVEALIDVERTEPLRFVRGHKRAAKSALVRWRNAKRKLCKLDPDFCSRVGI